MGIGNSGAKPLLMKEGSFGSRNPVLPQGVRAL